jgi:hypothetical protein
MVKFSRTAQLMAQLQSCGLQSKLQRELVINRAIAFIQLDDANLAVEQFFARRHLDSAADQQQWMLRHRLTRQDLLHHAMREAKVEQFKHQTWGEQLPCYFRQRKDQLDRVIYSLLQVRDAETAQRLYFQLVDNPAAHLELVQQVVQAAHQETQGMAIQGGLIGPVSLTVPHAKVAEMLRVSQPHHLWPPMRVGDWFVMVRLEQFLPARLDASTQQLLLDEQFESWVSQTLDAEMRTTEPKTSEISTM